MQVDFQSFELRGRFRQTPSRYRVKHDCFIETVQSLGQPVVSGSEAISNYHRLLAWRLLDAGGHARLISSARSYERESTARYSGKAVNSKC